MVIDSPNLNLNFTNLPKIANVLSQAETSGGRWRYYEVGLQDWLHGDEFSLTFMFDVTPLQKLKVRPQVSEYIKAIYPVLFLFHHLVLCLKQKLVNFDFKWTFEFGNFFYSIHVMGNLPKVVVRQCTPLPPEWQNWN